MVAPSSEDEHKVVMVFIGGCIVERVPFGMVERTEIVRGGTEQLVVQTDSAFLGLLITYGFESVHRLPRYFFRWSASRRALGSDQLKASARYARFRVGSVVSQ